MLSLSHVWASSQVEMRPEPMSLQEYLELLQCCSINYHILGMTDWILGGSWIDL